MNDSAFEAEPSGRAITDRLDRYGFCVVRGVLPAQLCDTVSANIARNAVERNVPQRPYAPHTFPLYFALAHTQPDWLEKRLEGGRPLFDPATFLPGDNFDDLSLPVLEGAVGQAVRHWVGRDDVRLRPGNSMARLFLPHATFPDLWHQDGTLQQRTDHFVTAWFALTPCGQDASAIQIVPERFFGDLPTTDGNFTAPDAVAGHARYRPIFERGDVLLHTEFSLHGTYASPAMTKPRASLDLRFF
jgi:ectoine hydroxylase-related dioxygenase (phytanoyl-CoA dioxygenase family)